MSGCSFHFKETNSCGNRRRQGRGQKMKREEFDPVYVEYHQMVTHLAYDVLHDYDLAQDVCQEVFMKLDEKIESLDRERIKGWLLRCGKRKAIDFVRRAYRKNEVSVIAEKMEEDFVVEYLLEIETEKSRKQFRNFVLDRLREKNQTWYELLVRVVVESEPAVIVAEEYGITVENLRMKISRARHWLYKNYYQSYLEL